MKKYLSLLLISALAIANIGPFPGGSGGGGGSGTVTSVGMSVPSLLSVSGSPITTSGTLAVTYSGTALPVANGGTGATTLTSNNVLLGNGTSAVQLVAPGTSGNVLTSNGSTWASTAVPAQISGLTTGLFTKAGSSSTIVNSSWKEGATNGEFQFNNFAAAKGTKTAPLLDLSPSVGSGWYTDSSSGLNSASAGVNLMSMDGTTVTWHDYSTTLKDVTQYNSGGNMVWSAPNTNSSYSFKGGATTSFQSIQLQDSGANVAVAIYGYTNGSAASPGSAFIQNFYDDKIQMTKRGTGASNRRDRMNAWTVTNGADVSNIGGTTTVNASTTVTGSGTTFTADLGVGDYISVSSSAGTYARVSAIASNTSLTVDVALGNGTSQTINKKQIPQRWELNDGTYLAQVDNAGKFGCRSGVTCGTSTCNGSTEVTVNTTSVTASTIIHLTEQAPGGTPLGVTFVSSRVAGTSFGFKCAATDTSTVGWILHEPY